MGPWGVGRGRSEGSRRFEMLGIGWKGGAGRSWELGPLMIDMLSRLIEVVGLGLEMELGLDMLVLVRDIVEG